MRMNSKEKVLLKCFLDADFDSADMEFYSPLDNKTLNRNCLYNAFVYIIYQRFPLLP